MNMTEDNRAVLAVLNVFNRPEDFPDKVVVRWQYVYSGGRIVNEPEALLFETTADAEAHIEREYPWMTRIAWGPEAEATHLWGSWI